MAPDETRTTTPAAPISLSTRPAPESTRTSGQAPHRAPVPAPGVWVTRLLVVGIVLAALNLRPAITSFGALLEEVRDGLGMSGSMAGLLTSVPPLCFAVFGVMAPRLSRRFGPGAVVCAGLVAIAAGLALRPFVGGTIGFLAASALALMGIAVSNVLMPVIVKQWFPDKVGPMTGLYSMGLALGTAAAAAVTVPVTHALGGSWRWGLAVWALLALTAVLPWAGLVRDRTPAQPAGRTTRAATGTGAEAGTGTATGTGTETGAGAGAGADGGAGAEADGVRVTRSPTAWALAVFFGLQATAAYVTMGWMPQIFRDAGVSADRAGLLLAVTMVMGVPLAFVIPRLATRLPHQGPIVAVLGVCGLAGYAGLFLAPAGGAWVWALLLGVSNCAFPLALTMVGMRAGTGAGVAKLSAFAQSTGYLISIPGPLLVGVLYQHSGGWGLPITMMAGLMVPLSVFGVLAGRNRTIEDECAAAGAVA